ncbi:hypothetical protein QQZ08_006769 [Neonectria magnoliae]|uniref:Aminoglycoside phosphotransferase domain-containing protein n=1 Tax=Neonectria magnoliae TaxID=2732573 RepID=A0ABR1HZQ9_9HYPO
MEMCPSGQQLNTRMAGIRYLNTKTYTTACGKSGISEAACGNTSGPPSLMGSEPSEAAHSPLSHSAAASFSSDPLSNMATASRPQPVDGPLTQSASFLVLSVSNAPDALQTIRRTLTGLESLSKNVSVRDPSSAFSCTVGIGSEVWDGLTRRRRPVELRPFREVRGTVHTAVSTPGDLLFHIRSERRDICFEFERQLLQKLGDAVAVVDETVGFRYFDFRDLLGFVDGTANPVGPAVPASVLVADEDASVAGGSYVVVQKYLHKLDAWRCLSTEKQEAIVGRTKLDNVELDDAESGQRSHKTLATITGEEDVEHDIVRDNMPFGSPGSGEYGTYFVGYTRRLWVIERMLQRMFVGDPPGLHDRILDFSTPITGTDAHSYDSVAREAEGRELAELINTINTRALEAQASDFRQGVPCSVPPLQYDRATRSSVMGGMNYHVDVRFDDGITWIACIRRFNATSPPPALRDYIVRSEVATLKFLERTDVPAPRVYDFALECPGNPRKKVMSQLADVFVELHKHPFELLGSLDSPGGSHVGAFARESLADFVQSQLRTAGPFSSLEDYHTSSIRLILDLIVREEMYSLQAVDAYLIHRYLLDIVPRVLPSAYHGQNRFYLKHADDKGDHILVDDDFNITGIIDWEWAHTASPAHAFNSPIGFLPVGDFYRGSNSLGDDEVIFARLLEDKGHRDLAQFVWNGRLQHRFAFCCGYNLVDWDGFLGLFRGLRDNVGADEGLEWTEWKATALQRYKDDAGLQRVLAKQTAAVVD